MTNVLATTNVVELSEHRIDLAGISGQADFWDAGLDMGSGISTLYIQAVKAISKERVERSPIYRLSFPSMVDTGEGLLTAIANIRNAPRNRPASCLQAGEFVLRMNDSSYDHLVGHLALLEGQHPSDAKGDANRYWGEHIKRVACTLIAAIVPDTSAQVRLNFCMPLSLYTPENKERAINNLDGVYRFYLNEVYHELDIRVGSVIPEGYAAIAKCGSLTGSNATLDVGDRTSELVFARGFTFVSKGSEGRTYGVRQIIDEIATEIKDRYGRVLDAEEVRVLLKAYSSKVPFPRLKVSNGYLNGDAQQEVVHRKVVAFARVMATFIRSRLNQEGADVGANLETVSIYGGGSHLLYDLLKNGIPGDPDLEGGVLPDLFLPFEPEYLNALYLLELVAQQTQNNAARWERKRA